MEFTSFSRTARFNRKIILTEKIDGTNGQILVVKKSEVTDGSAPLYENQELAIFAGSRNRFISVEDDNYGFAKWVLQNGEELLKLGEGRHFGEWWGKGIGRGYEQTTKKFSLFNVGRWNEQTKPACCEVVPIICEMDKPCTEQIQLMLGNLRDLGSLAAPGFMNPEGIIIYHSALNDYFKITLKGDEHKWQKS